MTHKNQAFWNNTNKSSDPERLDRTEEKRNHFNAIITVFLTAVIIAAGFLLPTVVYSAVESGRDNVTVLASSEGDDVLLHVFDEPVSLYPWSFYTPENTSELSPAEQSTLLANKVPQFLIKAMLVYGMDVDQLELDTNEPPSEYVSALLIDACRFLQTDAGANQGCFVVYALDINADGRADIRYAVDQNGAIISLIFLSAPWTTRDEGASLNSGSAAAEPALGQEPLAPDATQAPEGATPEGAATDAVSDPELIDPISPYALDLSNLERMPVDQELALWSFVHFIAVCAAENGQFELEAAASLLDTGFNTRYASSGNAHTKDSYLPTPTAFATEEYDLYLYDLPTDVRFILYYDALNARCVGFNLQL